MTANTMIELRESGNGVPSDLRRLIGDNALINLAVAVAQDAEGILPAGLQGKARDMLALLTCCYATGRYDSETIEWASKTDPMVQVFSARDFPTASGIQQFRRANRQLIEKCLAHVFLAARQWTANDGWMEQAPGFEEWSELQAEAVALARRRVQQAILFDVGLGE